MWVANFFKRKKTGNSKHFCGAQLFPLLLYRGIWDTSGTSTVLLELRKKTNSLKVFLKYFYIKDLLIILEELTLIIQMLLFRRMIINFRLSEFLDWTQSQQRCIFSQGQKTDSVQNYSWIIPFFGFSASIFHKGYFPTVKQLPPHQLWIDIFDLIMTLSVRRSQWWVISHLACILTFFLFPTAEVLVWFFPHLLPHLLGCLF